MVIKITSLALALILAQTFEVASVRPTRDTEGIREFQIQPGGRLVIMGMSLKDLVRRAYLMSDIAQDETRAVGGPPWVNSDRFDILAKADGDAGFDADGRPQRLLARLRSLLETRFKLKTHIESREMQIYDLVVAGNARRPQPSSLDCKGFQQGIPRPVQDPVRWCGIRSGFENGVARFTAHGVTMAEAAASLGTLRSVSRPVRDRTGLTGRFDFELEYAPVVPGPPIEGATIFTAIQERAGLKLQPAKAPVDFVVIDSAEHPTTDD